MGTGTYNLCINQGATYQRTFLWTAGPCCGMGTAGAEPMPVNLTGYTAEMQIRPFPGAPILFYDASADLTLGGIAGTISLSIDATDTEGFSWIFGYYDLLLTSPTGIVTRLLSGSVTVSLAVSMPAAGQPVLNDAGVVVQNDAGVAVNTSS
jgi:hypothetical protein